MPSEAIVPDEPLRDRLVRAGAALLAEEGASGVTLRAIARGAGVSHGAPRRYFPTRTALLSAVAAQGFQALHKAMDADPDPPSTGCGARPAPTSSSQSATAACSS